MKKKVSLFSIEDKVVLKTLSKLLLKSHEASFSKPPLNVKIDPELWADINLDMANELITSIKLMENNDMANYKKFISSNYSTTLKELIDFNTNNLLEYYNRMRNIPYIRKLYKVKAKKRLNNLRYKLGMVPI